jgi:hypothetical protein
VPVPQQALPDAQHTPLQTAVVVLFGVHTPLQQVSVAPQQDWLGAVPHTLPLGQQMVLVPVPMHVWTVEQQAIPQTWAVGQQIPLLQVSAVEQQAEAHTWLLGQQMAPVSPVAMQISLAAQHSEPQTWKSGQQMAFAPMPMQASVLGAQQTEPQTWVTGQQVPLMQVSAPGAQQAAVAPLPQT